MYSEFVCNIACISVRGDGCWASDPKPLKDGRVSSGAVDASLSTAVFGTFGKALLTFTSLATLLLAALPVFNFDFLLVGSTGA